MHRLLLTLTILVGTAGFGATGLAFATTQTARQTAEGLWQHTDEQGRPVGWFRIEEKNGVYQGQIVRMFPKGSEDPTQFRCTQCEGEQKNAPVLGITFIKGMQRNGRTYENGTILDPRDGSVYSAKMQLSPDGQQLEVRGYLGISLFGQSQMWTRLPDNALQAVSGSAPASTSRPAGAKRAPPSTGSAPRERTR